MIQYKAGVFWKEFAGFVVRNMAFSHSALL